MHKSPNILSLDDQVRTPHGLGVIRAFGAHTITVQVGGVTRDVPWSEVHRTDR